MNKKSQVKKEEPTNHIHSGKNDVKMSSYSHFQSIDW